MTHFVHSLTPHAHSPPNKTFFGASAPPPFYAPHVIMAAMSSLLVSHPRVWPFVFWPRVRWGAAPQFLLIVLMVSHVVIHVGVMVNGKMCVIVDVIVKMRTRMRGKQTLNIMGHVALIFIRMTSALHLNHVATNTLLQVTCAPLKTFPPTKSPSTSPTTTSPHQIT